MEPSLLHAFNQVRSSHTELVGDIDQAFKGDSAPTTFDSLENASRKANSTAQILKA